MQKIHENLKPTEARRNTLYNIITCVMYIYIYMNEFTNQP